MRGLRPSTDILEMFSGLFKCVFLSCFHNGVLESLGIVRI